jgi:hypothetical protein
MYGAIQQHLTGQLDDIRKAGLFMGERTVGERTEKDRLKRKGISWSALPGHGDFSRPQSG